MTIERAVAGDFEAIRTLLEANQLPVAGPSDHIESAAIELAGLRLERIEENPHYQFISDRAKGATSKLGVKSASVLAQKP